MTRTIIDPLNLTIGLPEGFVQPHSDLLEFCSDVETRYPRCFSIKAIESMPEDVVDWQSVALADGGTFYYHRTEWVYGGSGGPEERLKGYVVIDAHYFEVKATHQDKYRPDSTWCIPIIKTLRYEDK